ncbi:cytochrome d ubiquinol oxidase subunit II [Microbacteriaceae bacterium SG_E_30_P1]|uniref:Cytochrome d ubiquinol oxidase subunit II n=1 Tax=Antiquaquibacter oligotrophicus TaxID=2880260 RepID=A0ABT6KPW8_9MICO|nr:cytochrome d ubiquinol oxidase subunit II [Antiquaquibacter oligotrophicus]MDH6182032.1 cytochrome d ubiquinol oxidase subunit II [Antiquaquibacter oligotrophicus]UDF12300.1 cytochrome d ubiquinol oxidase subunit II [Antiquaquibacter oligotrophicus]
MEFLPTVWFIAIAVLWIGYLLLEGFDLGVGMHVLTSTRSDKQRRLMLNTIGPVWDGNEVWLITAGAATFAAFPLWYASLFSALYIPLVIVLASLIFRAVAIEYRGKRNDDAWRRRWDLALGLGSFGAAFGVGAALALTTTGLPLNENGDRVGGAFAWLTPYAVLGGLAVVGFCLVHGAAFLALKTDGEVRERARRFVVRWSPVALLPIVAWVLVVQFQSGGAASWVLVVLAVVAIVGGWLAARAGREGWSFIGIAAFVVAGAASIFTAVFPVVLPSTIDPAFNLTISNASSGEYTLGVMSVVALIGLPIVLAYQAWTYWVFRKRISEGSIPDAHTIVAAVGRRATP